MAAGQKQHNDNIVMRNEKKNLNDSKKGSKKARPGFERKVYGKGKTISNNKGK
jgi:hypothetical protein